MVLRFFLFAATFLLASCVAIERNNPDDPGSANYTGTRPPISQIVYGPSVTYKGETYETVVIGTQTWFQRNLNYAVEGRKCYDNETAYCNTYGGLYDWATAMALPSSCNSGSCASQIGTKHKGICPDGWHIPSDNELTTLISFVGESTAAKQLKATSGWNRYLGGDNYNGTDNYGFAALPSGGCYSDGGFANVGGSGNWWNATEFVSDKAYIWYIQENNETGKSSYNKNFLFSIRCLKD